MSDTNTEIVEETTDETIDETEKDYTKIIAGSISVADALAYLGIDYSDDMVKTNIERAIKTADAYLKGSIGEGYPSEDPRAKELALIIISDLYDKRGVNETVSGNVRRLVDDLSLQLRLELRRAANE